ncbi:MAG TPA: heavy metal-associated domain-containing protein [Pseudonocardiaceae bacterium]|nr:heavy metal-associated domain-containing protein [Pseudonocardiaceae bacterium]
MTSQTSYTVAGMTCAHCASAVREEIGKLSGVQRVDVDITTGRVTVASTEPLAPADVAAAVDEAGYELAGS